MSGTNKNLLVTIFIIKAKTVIIYIKNKIVTFSWSYISVVRAGDVASPLPRRDLIREEIHLNDEDKLVRCLPDEKAT